jgi:hypothetical protein
VLASFAMGWWEYNGLVPGQTVDAHIEEAAYRQTQDGEDDYQKDFHGRLLWTYRKPEVNSSPVLQRASPAQSSRVLSSVIARGEAPKQSRCMRRIALTL